MQFDSFSDFIAMGGYGFYVWLSFGLCVLLMVGIILTSIAKENRILREVAQKEQRDQRVKKAKELEKESQL